MNLSTHSSYYPISKGFFRTGRAFGILCSCSGHCDLHTSQKHEWKWCKRLRKIYDFLQSQMDFAPQQNSMPPFMYSYCSIKIYLICSWKFSSNSLSASSRIKSLTESVFKTCFSIKNLILPKYDGKDSINFVNYL